MFMDGYNYNSFEGPIKPSVRKPILKVTQLFIELTPRQIETGLSDKLSPFTETF